MSENLVLLDQLTQITEKHVVMELVLILVIFTYFVHISGCYFDGRRFKNGDQFNLSTDPCVHCTCKVRYILLSGRCLGPGVEWKTVAPEVADSYPVGDEGF